MIRALVSHGLVLAGSLLVRAGAAIYPPIVRRDTYPPMPEPEARQWGPVGYTPEADAMVREGRRREEREIEEAERPLAGSLQARGIHRRG